MTDPAGDVTTSDAHQTPPPQAWSVKPTGDVTLSLLSESGRQILKIDLRAQDIMPAGDNGDRLVRAWNDLCMMASIPVLLDERTEALCLRFTDAGHSPMPWSISYNGKRRYLSVRDANGTLIAGRRFGTTMDAAELDELVSTIESGIHALNTRFGLGLP